MEPTTISFTLAELYKFVIATCGLITAVSAVIGIIVSLVMKAKTPNRLQNGRLDAIEKRLMEHDKYFDTDNKRLKSVEEANRLTQRALLALLRHGIDGNEVEEMKRVESDLHAYLIENK